MIYYCTRCKADALGGGSVIYGGMFFKLCPECFENEEVIREMNEYWKKTEEENQLQEIDK